MSTYTYVFHIVRLEESLRHIINYFQINARGNRPDFLKAIVTAFFPELSGAELEKKQQECLENDCKKTRLKIDPLTEAAFSGLPQHDKDDFERFQEDLEVKGKKRKREQYEEECWIL